MLSARVAQQVKEAASIGAVRRAPVSSSDFPKTHVVEVGALTEPFERALWRSACGWRFGNLRTDRRPLNEADCKGCIQFQAKALGRLAIDDGRPLVVGGDEFPEDTMLADMV